MTHYDIHESHIVFKATIHAIRLSRWASRLRSILIVLAGAILHAMRMGNMLRGFVILFGCAKSQQQTVVDKGERPSYHNFSVNITYLND